MDRLLADLCLGMRRLRLNRGATLFSIASLAVGIGVSAAIYSAVRTLFWTPLGIAQPERAVAWSAARPPQGQWSVSWLDFLDLRAQQTSFSSMAAASRLSAAIAFGDVVETDLGEAVSGDYFKTLGISALYGRLLQPADETSAARVAVVSETFWRTRLHEDAKALGRSLTLGGESYELVGVTHGSFHGLAQILPCTVWIPATATPDRGHTGWPARQLNDRSFGSFFVWGRLKPDVTITHARAEAALIAQHLDTAFPLRSPYDSNGRLQRRTWTLTSGSDASGDLDRIDALGFAILFAVITVLFIACTNLANLSLAEGTSRVQEIAVRTALGASRGRLMREYLLERGIVTVAGAGLGLVLMRQLTRAFSTDLPVAESLVIHFTPAIDVSVLIAATSATTIAFLVIGLWPAMQSTRADVRRWLGAGSAATPPRWRLHRGLVSWQVAGSVAMVLVAAMCVEVTASIGNRDSGVDYKHLALAQVDFALNGDDEPRGRALLDSIVSKLRAQPGIQKVSASAGLPFGVMGPPVFVTSIDKPFVEARDTGSYTKRIAASPEVFSTLGLKILRGRAFSDRDDAAAPSVTVLSEGMARELFQTTDVVGRSISVSRWSRLRRRKGETPVAYNVIGISRDTDTFIIGRRGNPVIFVPLAQQYEPRLVVAARSQNPTAATAMLNSVIRDAAPHLALSAVGTGERLLLGPYLVLRIIGSLAGGLGGVALLLAMVGLYGVLSHVVARRTREIGIRMAMGADRHRILSLILRDGFRPVLTGLALGLFAGVILRVILKATVVTTISPVDVVVFSLVPVPFVIAAVAACYVPAMRAARVDPNVALRDL
jgi:putative ABC transport system permease protein